MLNMKLTAIFIVLVAVATVVSGQTIGLMTTSDNNYAFSWGIVSGRLNGAFAVRGTDDGTWAAIGFSEDMMMPISDVVIGGNNGAGQSFVEDRWITNGRSPSNVVYDTIQDITVTSATRIAGVLTVTFSRPLNTTNPMDVTIGGMDDDENNCVYVLWAYGGTVGDFSASPVTGLTGHSAKGVFPTQLCGCTSIMVSLGVLLLGALIATFATY